MHIFVTDDVRLIPLIQQHSSKFVFETLTLNVKLTFREKKYKGVGRVELIQLEIAFIKSLFRGILKIFFVPCLYIYGQHQNHLS